MHALARNDVAVAVLRTLFVGFDVIVVVVSAAVSIHGVVVAMRTVTSIHSRPG